jgi:hypothetical protein
MEIALIVCKTHGGGKFASGIVATTILFLTKRKLIPVEEQTLPRALYMDCLTRFRWTTIGMVGLSNFPKRTSVDFRTSNCSLDFLDVEILDA